MFTRSGDKPMIAEAFIRLSKSKRISTRSRSRIWWRPDGISGQTFYYHFQGRSGGHRVVAGSGVFAPARAELAADDPEAVLRGFLETSEESAELLQKLLHSQKREQVERLLVRSVRTYLKEVIERRGPVPGLSYEGHGRTALSFCTYGVVGLLLEAAARKRAPTAPAAHGRSAPAATRAATSGRTGRSPSK